MPREIGTHIVTTERDIYKRGEYFRVTVTEKRNLHATKGWRSYRHTRVVTKIREPRERSFGRTIVRSRFERWV